MLGVAEGGEARDGVVENNGGTSVGAGLLAGDYEDSKADDGAESEPGEVSGGEAVAHGILASVREDVELVVVRAAAEEAIP